MLNCAMDTVKGFSNYDSDGRQVNIGFSTLEATQQTLGTILKLGNTSTRLTYPVPDRCFRLEGVPGQAKDSAIMAGLKAYCEEAGVELMGLPDRVTTKHPWLPPKKCTGEGEPQQQPKVRARYNGTFFFTIFDTEQVTDIPRFLSIEVEPGLFQHFPTLTPSGTKIEICRTKKTDRARQQDQPDPLKHPPMPNFATAPKPPNADQTRI